MAKDREEDQRVDVYGEYSKTPLREIEQLVTRGARVAPEKQDFHTCLPPTLLRIIERRMARCLLNTFSAMN